MIEEFSGQFIKLKNYCLNLELFDDRNLVILALSGGIDSVVLFHFLLWLKERKVYQDFQILAAHLNHGIRQEAKLDQAFVENLCKKHGIPLRVKEVDVPGLAQERSKGIEEAGRFARYEFFSELKSEYEAKPEYRDYLITIALGHHQDDLAESVLLNLSRGSGISGLATLRAKENEYRRPLLILSKEEIYELGQNQTWAWVEDESNQSDDYLRNRIRLQLIPLWNDILDYDVRPLLARLSNNLEEDENALNWMKEKSFEFCFSDQGHLILKRLQDLPKSLLKAVLEKYLAKEGYASKNITAIQMEQIWQVIQGEHGNKIMKIGDGLQFKREKNRLVLFSDEENTKD